MAKETDDSGHAVLPILRPGSGEIHELSPTLKHGTRISASRVRNNYTKE